MICDVSSQQFQMEALLVPEQIGNIEWWVRMFSSEEGGMTRSRFVTWRWLLWRQMTTSAQWWSPWDIETDGVEMESRWLVTTLHPVCDSNATGSDRHHLRSPVLNPNDKGGCHSLCSLQPSLRTPKTKHKAQWEVIAKEAKNGSALSYMWEEERAGKCWQKRLPVECFS